MKIVVEEYVRTVEAISSKAIVACMGGKVSSATIRNELAELTEQGYLEQPHTSAGRIPAPKGYRLYVDELMEQQRLSTLETEKINAALRMKLEELDRVISQVGQTISAFTRYPSYISAEGKKELTVRHFELLPVDESSCIAVLMLSGNQVKSQLIRMQLKVEIEQFPVLVNLLNAHFTAVAAGELGKRLMDMTGQLSSALFMLLAQVVSYACDMLEEQRRIVISGIEALLKFPEFRDVGKAHALMSVLSESKESLPVPQKGEPMQILIGPENVRDALRDTSVIVASYDIGEDMRGFIGVVGPTRMDYATVAARLAAFADGLTRLFGVQTLPPTKGEP